MKRSGFICFLLICNFFRIIAQTGLVWQADTEINSKLPDGIKLYKTAGKFWGDTVVINGNKIPLDGDTITAWYTATDLKGSKFIFQPVLSTTSLTPQQYFQNSEGDAYIVTNGGYFGGGTSYSLVINDGKTLVANIKALTRTCTCGGTYTYYPTRSAFGVTKNLKGEAQFVYSLGATNTTWAYPEPNQNTLSEPPKPQPSETYPSDAFVWDVSEAIGGGPLLIKNGIPVTNYEPELFQTDITNFRQPRTAIGITADSILINMVVDGRQSHSNGVFLQTLTKMLLELGCVDAMNLDGGGSSAIFVAGQLINKPSDGTQRAVPTAVSIIKASALIDTEQASNFTLLNQSYSVSESGGFGTSQSLVFEPGNTGYLASYNFGSIEPAYYRLDVWMNGTLSNSSSEDVLYIIDRYLLGKDTIHVNQQESGNSFITLGRYHLGPKDTIYIVNNLQNKTVQVDALRLLRVGKTNPQISLNPPVYYQNRATNEKFKLYVNTAALNGSKLLNKLRIYEILGTTSKIIYNVNFNPAISYSDSIEYLLTATSGEMKLRFTIFDELNDSSLVEYRANIRNNEPGIYFGAESVLTGGISDTLIFDIKIEAGSGTRPLKEMRISNISSGSNILLLTLPLDGLYANYHFDYKVKNEDIGNLEFLFEAEDELGYVGTKKHNLQVLHVNIRGGDSPEIWYSPTGNTLNIQMPPDKIRDGHFRIIDISGRELLKYPLKALSAQSVSIPSNLRGIYIVEFVSGTFRLNQKILINP